jgi:hypothetical protein
MAWGASTTRTLGIFSGRELLGKRSRLNQRTELASVLGSESGRNCSDRN